MCRTRRGQGGQGAARGESPAKGLDISRRRPYATPHSAPPSAAPRGAARPYKGRTGTMSAEQSAPASQTESADSADLAQYGYKQELKRQLGLGSVWAVAFSYISPSTGIFTLFALGLTTLGGVFIWTWPVVALGQFIVALNFAEVSSHYPVAG